MFITSRPKCHKNNVLLKYISVPGQHMLSNVKVKVNFTLEQATKTEWE